MWIISRSRDSLNLVFVGYLISLSIWILADFFQFIPFLSGFNPDFIVRLCHIGAAFSPAFFAHFVLLLSGEHRRRYKVPALYFVSLIFCILALFTHLFITQTILSPSRQILIVGLGIGYYVFIGWISILLVLCYRALLLGYRVGNEKKRSQIAYFVFATAIIPIALVIYFLALLGPMKNIRVDNLFHTAYAAIIAFAITKSELMDIKVVVTRLLSYIATGCLIIVSYVILFTMPIGNFGWRLGAIIIALIGTRFGEKWREMIQTSAERLWLRDWYNPQDVIKQISTQLSPLFVRDAILHSTATVLDQIMHVQKIIVVSRPSPSNPTKEFKVFNKIGDTLGTLPAESAINPFFNSRHAVLPRNQVPDPILDALSTFSKEIQVIIPLYSPDGFEGLLALGKRDSEAPYSAQDLDLLETVAATVGVFLDRMRPYERIQNEFNRNQKQLYDLERQVARSEKIASVMLAIKEFNHELKTPLSITRMMVDQLPATDETLRLFKDEALQQIDRAVTIIRQSLSLSGPKARSVSTIELGPLLKHAVKIVPRHITLNIQTDSIPPIIGSAEDWTTLFNNLLKNACEAISSKGAISIHSRIDADHIVITISDSGCGIPPDELPKIWDPFFVGQAKRTEGHGLGLSIAFRIVREHLGHLSVESQVGKGTTFLIRLPIGMAS